jgi:hypothetical protein
MFIKENYDAAVHSKEFLKLPALIFNWSCFKTRGLFMETLDHPDMKRMWEDFLELRETKINICSKLIRDEFESEFGLDVMHWKFPVPLGVVWWLQR